MNALLFATVLTLAPPGSSAYSEAQERALDNLADIVAMSSLCPGSVVDQMMKQRVLIMYEFEEAAEDELSRRALTRKAEMAEFSTRTACRAARYLYGPAGANAPNFILFEPQTAR